MDTWIRELLAAPKEAKDRGYSLRTFLRRIDLISSGVGTSQDEDASSADGARDEEILVKYSLTREELDIHLKKTEDPHLRFPPVIASGFRAATYQWLYPERTTWCEVAEFYYIGTFRDTRGGVLNIPEFCMARVNRLIKVGTLPDGRLKVRIVQRARVLNREIWAGISSAERAAYYPPDGFTTRFVDELTRLGLLYSALGPATPQILLLRIHHAHLNLFATFIEHYSFAYLANRMDAFFRVLKLPLTRWNFDVLATDAGRTQIFTSFGSELVATTEALLETVAAMISQADKPSQGSLAIIAAEIRGTAREVAVVSERMNADISQGLEHAAMHRDLRQSNNVRALTLLATFFVPMSLAAGVLSMQTRFRNLGLLLYDFFGVVVFSFALALIFIIGLYGVLRVGDMHRKAVYASSPKYKVFASGLGKVILYVFLSLLLISLVGSFAVGMFLDVFSGVLLLGFSVAPVFGAMSLPLILELFHLGRWVYKARHDSTEAGVRTDEQAPEGPSDGQAVTEGLDFDEAVSEILHGRGSSQVDATQSQLASERIVTSESPSGTEAPPQQTNGIAT